MQTYSNPPRERVLTDDELRRLWAWAVDADTDYSRVIRLILWTGLRRGEAAGVTLAELEQEGCLLLPGGRTKNGRPLLLPLSRQARTAIDVWRASQGSAICVARLSRGRR